MEARASSAVPPLGAGTPLGCVTAPNPVAYGGVLHAREDSVDGAGGVMYQGQKRGGVVTSDLGPRWSAAGLNLQLATGGKLSVSALIDGVEGNSVVCLTVGWPGQQPMASSCGPKTAPTVSVDVVPAGYVVQVALYPPIKSNTSFGAPCPPSGLLTCYGGVGWASSNDTVVVKQISYSLG